MRWHPRTMEEIGGNVCQFLHFPSLKEVEMIFLLGCPVFLSDTAPMLVESVFCSPFGLSNVNQVCTPPAVQFLDNLFSVTVDRRGYVPFVAFSEASMCRNSSFTTWAYHTLFAHKLALLPLLFENH